MSSEKSKTNKKWTSNSDYRGNYDRIFGCEYKPGESVRVTLIDGGTASAVIVAKNGDMYLVDKGGYEFEINEQLVSRSDT